MNFLTVVDTQILLEDIDRMQAYLALILEKPIHMNVMMLGIARDIPRGPFQTLMPMKPVTCPDRRMQIFNPRVVNRLGSVLFVDATRWQKVREDSFKSYAKKTGATVAGRQGMVYLPEQKAEKYEDIWAWYLQNLPKNFDFYKFITKKVK